MSAEQLFGMSESALRDLADYNTEVKRGLVHTDEWKARMAELQKRYDRARCLPEDALEWERVTGQALPD